MENLSIELVLTGISALILILVVVLPLLPAILIYKIFPDTAIQAKGTIGALTWNASGAFAAYMIVLAVIVFSVQQEFTTRINAFYNPTWTVELEIEGIDHQSKPIEFDFDNVASTDNFHVIFKPEIHQVNLDEAVLKIPGLQQSDWPKVYFHASGGSRNLDLAALKSEEIEIDYYQKKITVLTPVVIKGSHREEYNSSGSEVN